MIIFGWRSIVKNIGVVFKRMCDHCHNEEYWVLTRITRWFTLFFIPVLPLESKYFLSCPICKYGFDLKGEQLKKIKPLAELNQLLVDGKITEPEYHTRLNLLNGDSAQTVEARVIESQPLEIKGGLAYCASCGKQVTKELKFCGNCGSAVVTT